MFQLSLIFLFFTTNCRDAYLNKVLSDKTYGYYVVFKCDVEGKENEIIAPNYKVYKGLLEMKLISDSADYVRFMKEKIKKNEPFPITVKELDKMDAGNVGDDPEVVALAEKSTDSVINRYFYVSKKRTYARLYDDVPEKKLESILKILFERNYLLTWNEGKFFIDDLNFCNLTAK